MQRRNEFAASGGEAVDDRQLGCVWLVALHQAVVREPANPFGEQIGGDAGKAVAKVGIPAVAQRQLTNDQQRPPVADGVEPAGEGAVLVVGLRPPDSATLFSCPTIGEGGLVVVPTGYVRSATPVTGSCRSQVILSTSHLSASHRPRKGSICNMSAQSAKSTATKSRGKSPGSGVAFTTPGLAVAASNKVVDILASRLVALTDLSLTLKHIHWNVTGPGFIAVHQMLDPQYEGVADMVDDVAERIATLGGEPNGLPGHLVSERSWDDYELGRDTVQAHLGALDLVYTGVIESHRDAFEALEKPDPVTQDLIIGQTATLEQYHWFVRAHLENASGTLVTRNAKTEAQAARAARGRR